MGTSTHGIPIVEAHFGGHKATWLQFSRAFALFEERGDGVWVSDIFRDPHQPTGSAGGMLAAAFAQVGIRCPRFVRMVNILDTQPTTSQLDRGFAAEDTVLGATLRNLVSQLGGRPDGWRCGTERGKRWIEVQIAY